MRKVYIYVLAIMMLSSCTKEDTSGVSRVTNYVDIDLKGDLIMVIEKGSEFVDPGFTAYDKGLGKDVTSEVEVTGTVDTSVSDVYNLDYTALNKDNLPITVRRKVVVTPVAPSELSSIDLSGKYTGQLVASVPAVKNAVIISKITDGVFEVTDFYAGYYNLYKGYGEAYMLSGLFILDKDNNATVLSTEGIWGSESISSAVYNPNTNTLSYVIDYYGFVSKLTKQIEE